MLNRPEEAGPMHAVVGIWTMDEAWRDEQDRLLNEEIIPLVRGQPGFVSGYWMHDPETGKSHTAIVFDSRPSANRFRSLVEGRAADQSPRHMTT